MRRSLLRTPGRLGAALLCISLLGACATQPRPRIVEQATERIAHSDTTELETLQPRLIREAKQHEIDARKAYDRGDMDRAKLHAHMAIQRYETARNLVQRDSAQSLAKNMGEADSELAKEVEALAEERRELERYNQLQSRFDGVQGELSQVREEQQGAAAQARRLLLRARTRQAEALGAGASADAPREYAQARLLVEGALEAYDAQLFEESSKTSTQAIAAFDRLIEQSAESARNLRKEQEEDAARKSAQQADNSAGRKAAQAAIDEASDAQTAAIGARMPETQAPLYQQAQSLLQTAERRLRDEDFQGAERKAQSARDIFLQGAQGSNVVTTTAGTSALSGESRLAIQRAEDARAAALLRGGTQADMQRGDYALELARQAASRQDDARATQKANEATSSFEAITGMAAAPLIAAQPSAASALSSGLKAKAEEMIVELQLERAEALGQMKDKSCEGVFREFEAVLELAQQRYDARDYAQSFEFSVRASERLSRCDAQAATLAPTVASTGPRKPTPEERAEMARRDKAADALSKAQGDYAELSVVAPDDARLRKPAVLIASAEKWFNQRDYPQAEALAKRALEDMLALRTALDKERAVREAVASSKPKESDKPATPAVLDERTKEACRRVDTLMEQAKGAQLRASRKELPTSEQERYRRGVRTMTRASALREKDVCESAEILAEESLATFEELASLDTTPPAGPVVAASKDPLPAVRVETAGTEKADPAMEAAASGAIASARLARAKVSAQQENNVYQTADSLLAQAERQLAKKQFSNASALATQAAGAFASLDINATTTDAQGRSVDPSWKPAYSQVLDSLILRDEVQGQIGEAEQPIFARGVKNLTRSRTAWESKDFIAAGKFAQAADQDFKEALAAAKLRGTNQSAADKAAQAKLEQEAQEAREREAKAKAAKTADEKAAAAKLEQQAKEKEAREAAERKAELEKKSQAERDALRRKGDDALLQANIAKKSCEKNDCTLRDEDAMIRASETLEAAQRSQASGDFERATQLARQAQGLYELTAQKPRSFIIPRGVTRVTRQGDRLSVSPRVKFKSGGTDMVAESIASVDDLARVLVENARIVESVELVGYTDDRGDDGKNLALSEQRAAALRQSLVDRGVSTALIRSQGRGEQNPIATNKTAEGRELNRRVEVIVKLKNIQE